MAVDSTVQDLTKTQKQLASARQPMEADWYLNVAYYHGDQWIFWNRGRIDRPKLADWRLMLVDNRILPAVFSRVAKKVKTKPTFVATPSTLDDNSLQSTELGEAVLEDDWIHLNLQQKHFAAQMWAEVCGDGFWKIYWDKTKGDNYEEYVVDSNGQPYPDPRTNRPLRASDEAAQIILGQEGFGTTRVSVGDVCVEVLSPFEMYVDPLAETIEDCEIIVEEHIRSEEYIKRRYNKEVTTDTNVPIGVAESRMFPYISNMGSGQEYKGVTTWEMYSEKDNKNIVWTKDQVLEELDLSQAPFVECPYVKFSGVKVPGRFWSTAICTQLRGPQTELNKITSQIRENALRIGNPSLTKSRQANVFYTGVPGEVIEFDSTIPDAIPSYIQPPEMPAYVQAEIDRITNSITEISGLHEVSKATVPSGVTAASAINLLMEADDTRLGPEIQDQEVSLGKAGRKILKLRAKFQDDQRFIRSAGEDGEWDVNAFRGAMLNGIETVEVQAGSSMPRSQAARQAAMQEIFSLALQYGLDVRPRDVRKFLRDYGVGGLENLFASVSTDETQIRRENNIMKTGQVIDINDYDDDDLHIEGHNEYRKTKEFYYSPEAVQASFNAHVKAHTERRQLAIDAQVRAQQAMMNGGGPTQGVPTGANQ